MNDLAGNLAFIWDFSLASIRLGTPMMLAAMGGVLSERAGVVNIALEGQMLLGALFAAVVAHQTQNPWLGWCAGGLAGASLAMLLGLIRLQGQADPIVAGTGCNMLATGICPLLAFAWFGASGSTPALGPIARFAYAPTVIALTLPWLLWLLLRYTRGGLWITVAGENPGALLASGLSPLKVRYSAILVSGILAGWGGASLSIGLASAYSREISAGRGFMALAAVVLGKWHPLGALAACLMFGAAEALQMRLQVPEALPSFLQWLNFFALPAGLVQLIPYLATMLLLTVGVGAMRPPKALG